MNPAVHDPGFSMGSRSQAGGSANMSGRKKLMSPNAFSGEAVKYAVGQMISDKHAQSFTQDKEFG